MIAKQAKRGGSLVLCDYHIHIPATSYQLSGCFTNDIYRFRMKSINQEEAAIPQINNAAQCTTIAFLIWAYYTYRNIVELSEKSDTPNRSITN